MTTVEEIVERLGRLTASQRREVLDHIRTLTGEPVRRLRGEELVRSLPRISPEFARDLRMSLAESRRMPGQEDTLMKWAFGEDAEGTPAEPCAELRARADLHER